MVAIITPEQRDQIAGKEFAPDSFFNPVQDINNNWVISAEEIRDIVFEEFLFLKSLDLIEYQPKNNDSLF